VDEDVELYCAECHETLSLQQFYEKDGQSVRDQ
jgi:hypothetical protein